METITKRKLSHQVLDRLIAAIGSKEYPPGSQLPSERQLMTRYGVGRPAIREAMQKMEQMGLIRISQGERARVIVPSPNAIIDQITSAMVHLLAISPRGLEDLKEARLLFETGLVRVATERATREGIEALHRAMIECQETKGTPGFVAADMAFHRRIAAMSGNHFIEAVSQNLLEWLTRFRREMVSVRGAERLTLEEHERIYRAIAIGDADAAAKAMTDHLSRANALYSVLTGEDGRTTIAEEGVDT